MFRPLLRLDKSASSEAVTAALRATYLRTFALVAAPGVPLGALLSAVLGTPSMSWLVVALLALVALACAGALFWLAARARREADTPRAGAVQASIMLASAPAVPFLLGCTALGEPPALLTLWSLAALVCALGWRQVRA